MNSGFKSRVAAFYHRMPAPPAGTLNGPALSFLEEYDSFLGQRTLGVRFRLVPSGTPRLWSALEVWGRRHTSGSLPVWSNQAASYHGAAVCVVRWQEDSSTDTTSHDILELPLAAWFQTFGRTVWMARTPS